MRADGRLALLLMLGAMCCAGGCGASSKVTILSSRCEDPRDGTRLKALVFVSTLEATHLAGEQLVYQVRLFDKEGTPLRSPDGRYQTRDGIVAATTTMMVLRSPQRFEDIRVSIPAGELRVPANPVPAFGEITVSTAAGQPVGKAWCRIPPLQAADIMPPLPERPAPVPHWFVRVSDPRRLPTLLGPFESLEEAEAVVDEGTEPPRQVNSDDYLWFVPFYPSAGSEAMLVGPYASDEDVGEIMKLMAVMPDLGPKGLVAGAPVQIQVRQWLKEKARR